MKAYELTFEGWKLFEPGQHLEIPDVRRCDTALVDWLQHSTPREQSDIVSPRFVESLVMIEGYSPPKPVQPKPIPWVVDWWPMLSWR